ncbi:hypothetical protein AOA80_03135, partial [Methanomassiliicoccales archaeon RumEn M1]|jgi:hypothetical protein
MTTYSTPVVQTKVRPTGVTILSVLFGLESLLFIVAGIGAVGLGGLLGPIGLGLGIIVGIPLILLGLIGLLVTWGLWKGRGWARIVAIILAIIGLLVNLVGAIGLEPFSIVGLLINIVILWYLFQPHVKAYYA